MSTTLYAVIFRNARKQSNASMRGFAKELGVSASYIARIENGTRRPSEKLVDRLKAMTGLRLAELHALRYRTS